MNDPIAIANLIFSIITSICALYLSFAALRHSAKPKVQVKMNSAKILTCDCEQICVFDFINQGHWYARPTAIDVIVFCNFDPRFELIECLYGSTQSYSNTNVKLGVGKMKYLKAKGLKLTYGEEGEEVHVRVRTPTEPGKYLIRISAFSENGVSIKQEFKVTCKHENKNEATESLERVAAESDASNA